MLQIMVWEKGQILCTEMAPHYDLGEGIRFCVQIGIQIMMWEKG